MVRSLPYFGGRISTCRHLAVRIRVLVVHPRNDRDAGQNLHELQKFLLLK
jgi:hypothetical protein